MNLDKSTDIVRLTPEGKEKRQDTVVREIPLTIFVNNNELVTLQSSPDKLEYLAIGFLLSGGFIKGETRIKHIDLNKRGWYVRISLEILIKMVKGKVPVVVSHSAPTDLAIDLAEKMNVTLIGFVRGHRMNIYTHDYRII